MRIALCLYGQPRFLDNPNIKKFLDDKIFSQGNIDVYGHFWYDDEVNEFSGSDWHNQPTPFYKGGNFYKVQNTIDVIKQNYRLTNFIYEKPKNFVNVLNKTELDILANKKPNFAGENYYSINNVDCLLSHLYSIETSLNLLKDHKYDFVILTRYDSLILKMPLLKTLAPGFIYATNQHGHNGKTYNFIDNIFVMDGSLIKGLKAYSNIKNLINNIDFWTAENVKKENIIYFFGEKSIEYIDILVGVARNNTDTVGQAN